MFGLSFGELAVLIVVAIVVIGPKDLPKVLRKVGQWSGKLRRMAFDLRAQSGIDDVLNADGLGADLQEIRKLARGELDGVVSASRLDFSGGSSFAPAAAFTAAKDNAPTFHVPPGERGIEIEVSREREFPREGADAYSCLPDTAVVYVDVLPASAFAESDLFTCGIATPKALTNAPAPPPANADAPVPRDAVIDEPPAPAEAPVVIASPPSNTDLEARLEPRDAPP